MCGPSAVFGFQVPWAEYWRGNLRRWKPPPPRAPPCGSLMTRSPAVRVGIAVTVSTHLPQALSPVSACILFVFCFYSYIELAAAIDSKINIVIWSQGEKCQRTERVFLSNQKRKNTQTQPDCVALNRYRIQFRQIKSACLCIRERDNNSQQPRVEEAEWSGAVIEGKATLAASLIREQIQCTGSDEWADAVSSCVCAALVVM